MADAGRMAAHSTNRSRPRDPSIMLSYRHSFHAGNHGDVLKHWALVTMLDYLNQKEAPYWYIDTHAGAGTYSLSDPHSRKNREHQQGIDKLLACADMPESLGRYCEVIATAGNNKGVDLPLTCYPGSPAIAGELARTQDKLRFFELHSRDSKKLIKAMESDSRARVEVSDGFAGLKALLPPQAKRCLVMIDPPYEVKTDCAKVLKVLPDAVRRFAVGVYAVWYPLLSHLDNVNFQERILKFNDMKWMDLRLAVDARPNAGGMYGSGLFVINPPWQLQEQARQVLPFLAQCLGVEGAGDWAIRDSGNL